MNKNKKMGKVILIRVLLGFLAINAVLIIIGSFFSLTKVSSTGNEYPDVLSMLDFDESRNHQTIAIDFVTSDIEQVDSYGKAYLWNDSKSDSLSMTINVAKAGKYELALDYFSLQETVVNILLEVIWDSKTEEKESNIILPSAWTSNYDEITYDIYNNQVSGMQEPYRLWKKNFLFDQRYYGKTPLQFELSKGVHTLTIKRNQGTFYLGNIYLFESEELKKYSSITEDSNAKGQCITLEGENPLFKSDTSIQAGAVQQPNMYPYSSSLNRLNVLSGDSFNQSGYSVTYAFDIKEAGYYEFTFKYANTQSNTYSYADIEIDNISCYEELIRYGFKASNTYINETLMADNKEAMRFYLSQGTHTLTIRIDASLQSDIYFEMYNIIQEISDLYLEVVKLTGGDDDENRHWDIIKYIPDAKDRLDDWISRLSTLEQLINDVSKVNPKRDNTLYQYVYNAKTKLVDIAKKPNELPHKLAQLSTGTASVTTLLSNSLHTATFSPISIDQIYIHTSDYRVRETKGNFFLTYFSIVQRIFRSGTNISDSDEVLTVWVNRSTYYVSSMQKFADAYFTPKTGIKVRFSLLPDESKLTYSYAAGTQPDMALGVSSSIPYDLGIRGALEDLTQFDGFNQAIVDLNAGTLLNLGCGDSIYGLPETQDFQVLFYRTDLLDSLNIAVPNTWTDVINVLPQLQRYGMNFYIPMAGGSGLKSISTTAPFIFQYGGKLYTDDYMRSAIDSKEAIEAIKLMVDLFQLYSLPLTSQSFYESFRSGLLPMGVAGFDIYLQLANAAPEIEGKWKVALVPGVQGEDNSIDRTITADTKNGIIFKKTNHKEQAWQFMSWWLSADVQAQFANSIQATYGSTFLWNTANREAFKTLSIDTDIKNTILEQFNYVQNVTQIPATYILERGISNIWNSAVFNNESVRALITDSTIEMDKEITRKMKEFGYLDDSGNILKPYTAISLEEILQRQQEGVKNRE